MSVIPEAHHFLRTMPPLPQRVLELDAVVEESALPEENQFALSAPQFQWGLGWVRARSHWPR